MFPPIDTFYGFMIFAALCCVGGAGGLYVRNSKLSAHSCNLLNKSELRLFFELRKSAYTSLGSNCYVMAQVSYGEFLKANSRSVFFSFNSKRADFVLMGSVSQPLAVIEYQGSGHYGFNLVSRFKAMKSDRIKRRLLKRAQIPLLEVPADYADNDLETFFLSLKITKY